MPRLHTDPPTTDVTQKITIANLRLWGFLTPGHHIFSIVFHNPYTGTKNGRASAEVMISETDGWIRLNYSLKDQIYDYRIIIEAIPSNLGRGYYAQFRCPLSGLRCRTLYRPLEATHFAHRTVLGVKYSTQYDSGPFSGCVPFFKRERRKEIELGKPRRKKWYAGKPTRWFLALNTALQKNRTAGPKILASIRSCRSN
jgi:hypothetical protein